MFNEMDKHYDVLCFNESIMVCSYLDEGYSNNIHNIFKENPFGFFEYFKQLFDFDMNGIAFEKRLYIIKHYILFSCLTKQKGILSNVTGTLNKVLTAILIVPGYIKTNIIFRK